MLKALINKISHGDTWEQTSVFIQSTNICCVPDAAGEEPGVKQIPILMSFLPTYGERSCDHNVTPGFP